MREKLRNELLTMLNSYVTVDQLQEIEVTLEMILGDYEIQERQTEVILYNSDIPETVKIYIVTKKIEGLSEKSLYLYNLVLTDFFRTVQKTPEEVTVNDIRLYLYQYQKKSGISNRTLDTRRTVLGGYFGWMNVEGYIPRNPAATVATIKYERIQKKAMTQLDLERVRMACITARDKAIVETLYSTGCRVSELEHLDITDVNFETKEVTLFGKGSKHRISFINAKAEVALKTYLAERKDNNPALFVYEREPYDRLKKPGIELIVRKIMERANEVTTHVTPHVFRHTHATTALNQGMPIVEISKILGHSQVETTMQYITVDQESIKLNHRNCVI